MGRPELTATKDERLADPRHRIESIGAFGDGIRGDVLDSPWAAEWVVIVVDEERVAVRLRARHRARGDEAAAARLVFSMMKGCPSAPAGLLAPTGRDAVSSRCRGANGMTICDLPVGYSAPAGVDAATMGAAQRNAIVNAINRRNAVFSVIPRGRALAARPAVHD